MEILVNGLGQLESPRWHEGRLWVADWTAGLIRAIDAAGHGEVVAEHHSLPLCFDFLPDGTLVLASGPQRALLRMTPDGTFARYADLSTLSPYPSKEAVLYAARGVGKEALQGWRPSGFRAQWSKTTVSSRRYS